MFRYNSIILEKGAAVLLKREYNTVNTANMFKNDLVYRTTLVAALKHLVKYFINPFVPNAPFLYPLKTSENLLIPFDTP